MGLKTGRRVLSAAAAAAELPSWPPRKVGGRVLPENAGVAAPNAEAAAALKRGIGAGASGPGVGAACVVAHGCSDFTAPVHSAQCAICLGLCKRWIIQMIRKVNRSTQAVSYAAGGT